MDGPRQDKTSAPNERAAATRPSLALGPGFLPVWPSSRVLAVFSSAGGSQFTAQILANPHKPGLSSDNLPGA